MCEGVAGVLISYLLWLFIPNTDPVLNLVNLAGTLLAANKPSFNGLSFIDKVVLTPAYHNNYQYQTYTSIHRSLGFIFVYFLSYCMVLIDHSFSSKQVSFMVSPVRKTIRILIHIT